jgi:hypothetical protein
MRRALISLLLLAALTLAPAAGAQKKQKDPVLQAYLEQTFADLSAKLTGLADRLSVLEAEINRIKQQQAELMSEARNSQTVMKTTDTSLSSFRLSTQQEMLSLKTDLARMQRDLATLLEGLKKPEPAAPATPAVEAPKLEGYITADGDKEVTINLGSSAGVRAGMKFNVYRAADPKTQIGVIEIVEVLDSSNSKAVVLHKKADVAKFEFSDLVRLQ